MAIHTSISWSIHDSSGLGISFSRLYLCIFFFIMHITLDILHIIAIMLESENTNRGRRGYEPFI
jgi:hypothetical protein